MADNTTLNAGTGGDVIATDDVSGVKYQRVKLVDGTLDSTTGIPGDATNGLDVDVTRETATASGAGAAALPSVVKVVAGYDGTHVQAVTTDSSGRIVIVDGGGSITVDGTVAVSGTTAVSASALPLPSGASTSAKQPALGTAGSASADVLSVQGIASMTALKVDGSAVTQPVSAAALPLPSGAATAAKQPALGTAGSASSDVLTVQGITSMTALKVDGSATTQPVSGTVTANAGTGTMAVSLASVPTHAVTASGAFPVTDNAGSLTVDAPVGTPVFVTLTPSTTGGWSKVKYAAQTTTVQTPKSSAGTFGGYFVWNPNSAAAYVQVFDATSVTLGTTAPDMIFAIPPTSGANLEITNGVNMANAIKLACTTTATGNTAPTTGLDMTVFYK